MTNLYLLGQVVLGAYFVLSGLMHFAKNKEMVGYAAMKKVPMPSAAVAVTGLMMIAGGAGVLLQYQLVWSYTLLIAFLVLAAFLVHGFWADKDEHMKAMDMTQFQKNLALAAALLMLLSQVS